MKNGAQVKNIEISPADREVLIVEFKVDFPKPAKTDRVIAVGEVALFLPLSATKRSKGRYEQPKRRSKIAGFYGQ